MIHYQLRCSQEHGFDGWFKDSAAFDAQAGRGLVACPTCGDTAVNRALMAPSLSRPRKVVDQSGQEQPGQQRPGQEQPGKAAILPDAMRAALQRLRADVEKNCDYVGSDFAEEARRIHRGESERTGIYGESTPDQAEALAEEGIKVARIPWLPRADG